MDVITKKTTIGEARKLLEKHCLYSLPKWWEIVIFSLLNDCEYLEIVGFGSNTEFVKHYIQEAVTQ